jgi:hypothetical protein
MPFQMLAQELDYLRGRVLDQNTGEPVVFATVRIVGKAKGVITNMDGSFRLPLSFQEANDTIEVSSMGYDKKKFELQRLSPIDINVLYLSPGVLSLSEAVVSAKKKRELSAKRIVRRAIENIPNNYPSSNFAAVGYYRDYQIKEDNYVNLNEAILEVVDSGFDTDDENETKVRIYDYRPNETFEQDEDSKVAYNYLNRNKVIENAYLRGYGGNEFTILRIHDALRNYKINSYDFVNVMERDFIRNHSFKREIDIKQDGEELFVITFKQSMQPNNIVGKLYVSKTDYAIHKLEYTLYDAKRKLRKGHKNRHGTRFELIFEVITEYKRKYEKMFPNYISFINNFKAQKAPLFHVEKFDWNGSRGCFVVHFSDFVHETSGARARNYILTFRRKQITFDKMNVRGDKVEMFPRKDDNFKDMLDTLYSPKYINRKDLALSLEVLNVKNKAMTSTVNKTTYEYYKQYREFFVQEIKPNGSVLKDTLFMKKDRPIFQDQPMLMPDNFSDYWMNTPLPIPTKQKNALEFSKAF